MRRHQAFRVWPTPAGRLKAMVGLALLLSVGCADGPRADVPEGWLAVDLEKSDPERLLRYYMGSYVTHEGGDPVAAGLVHRQAGRFYVDTTTLAALAPAAAGRFEDANDNGTVDWDEFTAFITTTYYDARGIPASFTALREAYPYAQDDSDWFSLALRGVMTTAERHLYVPVAALRAALAGASVEDRRLLYPVGTAIIGEHHEDGQHLETTVMRKRADGFWDYFVYDAEGRPTTVTQTGPRALDVPVQCVGCHFGSKLFEPERSFPAAAPPGPHGPRGIEGPEAWRDATVTAFFDEHRRRSDTVLGLYNTLFVGQLRAHRAAGRLGEEDRLLLEKLGL